MPENEFLELCRDTERIESYPAFKEAGLDALTPQAKELLLPCSPFLGHPMPPLEPWSAPPSLEFPYGEAFRPSAKACTARHKAPPLIPFYMCSIRQNRRALSSKKPSHRAA